MDKESIETILKLNRPAQIDTLRGKMIYSDREEQYNFLIPPINRKVSNLESLFKAILEETRRRIKPTGDNMTVIFDRDGATFYPDDDTRLDSWNYRRSFSEQWEKLMSGTNRQVDHVSLLRILQSLKPSIVGYADIFRDFRKVQVSAGETISSAPILEDGQAGTTISFTSTAASGNASKTSKLPAEITFKMPLIKGDTKQYEMTVDVDAAISSENKENKIKFSLLFFEKDLILEQLIQDEIEAFKAQVKSLSNLLILFNL